MVTKTLQLRRQRKVTAEIFEDGAIVLEVTKDAVKPNYKNGESDYHEVCFNLTYGELDGLVEFLMDIMSISKEGGLTINLGEKENVESV